MSRSSSNKLTIPEFALVLMVGASGSGKSTFAKRHFLATEIVSSDVCRGLVSDDENSLEATGDAFALVHAMVDIRLRRRKLTVVDATNVRAEDRKALVEIAKRHHALPVAIVIDPGEAVCHERNLLRPDRQFGPHVVRNHRQALRRGLGTLKREGFGTFYVLDDVARVDAATIERQKLWTDRRDEKGPFDIIGDVHGCADELEALLAKLGYIITWDETTADRPCHVLNTTGRKAIFLGDLVDRGPRTPDVLRIVMAMVTDGHALCVLGNHDAKFLRWLHGRDVKLTHGLDKSAEQMAAETASFRWRAKGFIDRLVSHYWLDGGKLVVCHAGIKEAMIGRASGAIRQFCLYGETTGESDEYGLPIRHNWAAEYRGDTRIVYGHTPTLEAEWLNNTLCIDTGCVFGGKLTALRYPEMDLVSVPAHAVHCEPVRPLGGGVVEGLTAQQENDDTLDLADVSGKRILTSRYAHSITVREENAAAALEVMVRFAVDPRWLIYLPPTMSPSETSTRDGYLEHPAEALDFYRRAGVPSVICEEKHMGSRAILVIARDADTARRRFGITNGEQGMIYTRTGRQFFSGMAETREAVARTARAAEASGLFETLSTDWLCLDAEIMPWSAKAQSLIEQQYGPVGAAGRTGLALAHAAAARAEARGVDLGPLGGVLGQRRDRIERFSATVRGYCWPISGLEAVKIAPFHVLAAEGRVFSAEPHTWHMATLARLAEHDVLFQATRTKLVSFDDEATVQGAVDWWLAMTEAGGEGMVIKPPSILVREAAGERGPGRIIQPAVKCRGRDYLRIIYGPDYDAPENLVRLRKRGLGAKRALAMREFALGLEALERFVAREPLRRVHECVFAVLALESEPIDPRL